MAFLLQRAATNQRRDLSQYKLTTGLDLGDCSRCYRVLDEAKRIVLEQRVATTPKALQAALERCRSAGLRSRLAFSWKAITLKTLSERYMAIFSRRCGSPKEIALLGMLRLDRSCAAVCDHLRLHQQNWNHALVVKAVKEIAQDERLAREILLVGIFHH